MDAHLDMMNWYLDGLDEMERERDEAIRAEMDALFAEFEQAMKQKPLVMILDDSITVLEPAFNYAY